MRRSFAQVSEEPFRVFFPAGVVLGTAGVSLWLAYYSGLTRSYPNIAHARLMIEGFMASFIFGFLATAGPRITSTRPFSLPELALVFTCDLFAAGAHVAEAHRVGDFAFLLSLTIVVFALQRRFRAREDSPPPNFVLVALGLVCGVAGAALVLVNEPAFYSRGYQIGNALLNECFVVLPVLGVAPFFIRRLLDTADEAPKGGPMFPLFVGVTIIAASLTATDWLRFAAIGIYVAVTPPWGGNALLPNSLRVAAVSIVIGFAALALFPIVRIGALHIVFISGLTLMVLTVATRVVLGHSGRLGWLTTHRAFFVVVIVLLFLAMISRFTADLAPRARAIHLIGAAICWLAAIWIWSARVLPSVRLAEDDAAA